MFKIIEQLTKNNNEKVNMYSISFTGMESRYTYFPESDLVKLTGKILCTVVFCFSDLQVDAM